LRTASPFDNPGFHAGARAEGNYNDMSRLHGTKFSLFMENTSPERTLGLLLGGVYSDYHDRTDSLNAYNQNIYGPSQYPFDGTSGGVPITVSPCCIAFGSILDHKKRSALSGTLEWRPSEAFTVAADALYTRLTDPQVGYNQIYYFPYATDQNGQPAWVNPTIQNGVVTGVTVNNFQPEIMNNTINRKVETTLFGLNASWRPTDRLRFGLDAYRSTASRPEGGTDTFMTAGLVTDQPYAQDIFTITNTPHGLPNLNAAIPPSQLGLTACPAGAASPTQPGYCSYNALMNSGFLGDNKYWSTHYTALNGYSVHDSITGFTLDGDYTADAGILSRVVFGLGHTSREKSRDDRSNDWTNGAGQYGTLYQTAGCPAQCTPYSFGAQGFNVISIRSLPNFMQGAGGSYPMVLPQLDVNQLIGYLKSLDGKPNPLYCNPYPQCPPPYKLFNFADTLPQVNPFNSYVVTEKTTTFYVEGLLGGTNWSGNIGVRVVHTTTTANTAAAVPVSLWSASNTSASQTWIVQYGTTQAIGAKGSYTMALPSLNLSYWAIPDRLQVRLAVARTMARPNLSELAPTSTNNAINGTPQLEYFGTAGLEPIKADQADLSVEWYYAPHAALTAAVFGKKIKNDIYLATQTNVDLGTTQYLGGPPGTVPGTPFPWTVTAPANGAQSTFSGLELTWQHILDNGFGIHAQFTATKTRSYDQYGHFVGAINAAPPTTESIGLIYDKGPLSADVNFDHASSYTRACSQCTEVPGWPAIQDPFNWLTASVRYKFVYGFEVYAQGKNLTNSIARTYLNGNPLLPWAPGQTVGASESGVGEGYSAYGRIYTLGVAFRY
jgi:iron complex outermembrane recepter protein